MYTCSFRAGNFTRWWLWCFILLFVDQKRRRKKKYISCSTVVLSVVSDLFASMGEIVLQAGFAVNHLYLYLDLLSTVWFEEPWCIVVWHLDIKCLLCVLVSLQRHTEAVEHLLFMYIYGRGSLCRLIGILGLTMARDHRKLVHSGAGCTESNNAAVISELSIWCASLFISIWPWTAE